MSASPDFARSYYGREYRDSVEGILTPERTASEISFIVAHTQLHPPASVADLGCGSGRHALEFARRGFDVTGIDLSGDALSVARSRMLPGMQVRFLQGDYAAPPARHFDLVTSLFTSFGFGSDRDNAAMLIAWCQRLSRGGSIVLEVWNRELILSDFRPYRAWRASAKLAVEERRTLDPARKRLHIRYRYTYADGRERRLELNVRLYAAAELDALLKEGGITSSAVFGSLIGEPYGPGARSLVIVGRKGGHA